MRDIQRHLLIDADDTLWENNIYYLQCTDAWKALLAQHGIDSDLAQATLDEVEHGNIPLYGYGPDSYQRSLGETVQRLLPNASDALVEQARACAALVLHPPNEIIDGVAEALEALRPTSQMTLVTKGADAHQRGKLERSGLGKWFDQVYVVPEKHAQVYRDIVAELEVVSTRTWMIGNSVKSDINPAIEAGLSAILVPHNHTWTAERADIAAPDQIHTVERFADLPAFFGIL